MKHSPDIAHAGHTAGSKWVFWALIAPFCVIALCLAASYLVRTQPVAGPPLARAVARWAPRLGEDVQVRIGSVEPLGLSALRARDVSVSFRRGANKLSAKIGALDVSLDWAASLGRGKLIPGTVFVRHADVELTRLGELPEPSERAASDAPPKPRLGNMRTFRLESHDVRLSLRAGPARSIAGARRKPRGERRPGRTHPR